MGHYSNYLYSVNTYLAYTINEKYYMGIHYVWCTSRFDEKDNPPSSNPKDIIWNLTNDVVRGDKHSAQIRQNRKGLLTGVDAKHRDGMIDDFTKGELQYIIQNAEINSFKPILYVINKNAVSRILIRPPVTERAAFFSEEYEIEELKTNQFDIIELKI